MNELAGSVAIVTGAARNIGRAIALELAQGGAAIAVTTRADMKTAETVVEEIVRAGGRAFALAADIAREDQVKHMVEETVARYGRLDILVNNASIRPEAPIESITLKDWRQVMSVTLDGPFLCIRAALPHLEKSGHAAIVNIGGLTAYTGAAHRAHVVAGKAGLDGLTKALAVELAPRGITVNLVSPGLIETRREGAEPEHRKGRVLLMGRRGRPEEVAAMARFLAGPDARYLTGQTIHVNGGAFMP